MLSQNKKKLVRSLAQKKYRIKHGLFLVEGIKLFNELAASDYEIVEVFTTNVQLDSLKKIPANIIYEVTEAELKSISCLEQPNEVLAVVKIPKESTIDYSKGSLVLDKVRDPGNLGTIIRTADWFGVQQIICSNDSVDCFNTKVIQASMGSIFRQQIVYADLTETLHKAKTLKIPVYGAFMEGAALNKTKIPPNAFIVMGNESRGISDSLQPFITKKITIPKIGEAESLNVAMAATVICYEWRRL